MTECQIDDLIWLDEQLTRPERDIATFRCQMARDERWGLVHAENTLVYLRTQMTTLSSQYRELINRGASAFERQLFLAGAEMGEKEAWIARELRVKARPPGIPGKVTEDEIERARSYPIADLIGCKNGAYVKCPFCPSSRFWAKGSIGHCFACNKTANSLRYMIECRGVKFVDAVKSLSGG